MSGVRAPSRKTAVDASQSGLRLGGSRRIHIFTASNDGMFVVHAPVLVTEQGHVLFHVARRNRIADKLADRPVLISISGREAYQSANWYVSENQVPTWHYEAVEIEGEAKPLSEEGLVDLLDRLERQHDVRHLARLSLPDQLHLRGVREE